MVLVAIFFIVLGVLVKYAKFHFLIAGYNTMTKDEKAKYDIEGIASIFRNGMWAMAFIIIATYGLAMYVNNPSISNIGFFAAIIMGIFYILSQSNSGRFKKDHP